MRDGFENLPLAELAPDERDNFSVGVGHTFGAPVEWVTAIGELITVRVTLENGIEVEFHPTVVTLNAWKIVDAAAR